MEEEAEELNKKKAQSGDEVNPDALEALLEDEGLIEEDEYMPKFNVEDENDGFEVDIAFVSDDIDQW